MTTTSALRLGALALALAGPLFVLLPPAAQAQDNSRPSVISPPERTTEPANIPDDKIDAAAGAVKSVSAVIDNYQQKVARAPEAEKQRLIEEVDVAVTKAVAKHGLSIDEYVTIIKVAEKDPVVRSKLLKQLD
jgi:hypothetical protein